MPTFLGATFETLSHAREEQFGAPEQIGATGGLQAHANGERAEDQPLIAAFPIGRRPLASGSRLC
jgi:hypothetical protein